MYVVKFWELLLYSLKLPCVGDSSCLTARAGQGFGVTGRAAGGELVSGSQDMEHTEIVTQNCTVLNVIY